MECFLGYPEQTNLNASKIIPSLPYFAVYMIPSIAIVYVTKGPTQFSADVFRIFRRYCGNIRDSEFCRIFTAFLCNSISRKRKSVFRKIPTESHKISREFGDFRPCGNFVKAKYRGILVWGRTLTTVICIEVQGSG